MSLETHNAGSNDPRTSFNELPSSGPADLISTLVPLFRIGGQILGGLLLLIGVYYALVVLGRILAAGVDFEKLAPELDRMVKLLDLQEAKLTIDQTEIPIGRTAAFSALCTWYVLSLWIPLSLIAAGTKLIWGPLAERKAFYNALEEFFRTARESKR